MEPLADMLQSCRRVSMAVWARVSAYEQDSRHVQHLVWKYNHGTSLAQQLSVGAHRKHMTSHALMHGHFGTPPFRRKPTCLADGQMLLAGMP